MNIKKALGAGAVLLTVTGMSTPFIFNAKADMQTSIESDNDGWHLTRINDKDSGNPFVDHTTLGSIGYVDKDGNIWEKNYERVIKGIPTYDTIKANKGVFPINTNGPNNITLPGNLDRGIFVVELDVEKGSSVRMIKNGSQGPPTDGPGAVQSYGDFVVATNTTTQTDKVACFLSPTSNAVKNGEGYFTLEKFENYSKPSYPTKTYSVHFIVQK